MHLACLQEPSKTRFKLILWLCWPAFGAFQGLSGHLGAHRGLHGDQTGSNCINGINVLENFRPWHVFGLDSKTASKDDVKNAFRDLAKIHHPDVGGDKQVFERIQKMRDSLLALMK